MLRLLAFLFVDQMTDLLGHSFYMFRSAESGEINVPMLTLCALADFFEVSTDYLLGRSGER